MHGQVKGVSGTSGSRTSETGGPNFCRNLSTTFFRRFPKNFRISPKKFHLSPKFLMTFFLVIDLFHVSCVLFFRRGAKSSTRHRYGGAKILTFRRNHIATIALSAPEGGQTPLPTSMGGPWPDLPPPWIRHWLVDGLTN